MPALRFEFVLLLLSTSMELAGGRADPTLATFVRTLAPDDECWIWHGTLNHGYPVIGRVRVHRMVFEIVGGPIPEGFEVDHICGVRACINPRHLQALSGSEHRKVTSERAVSARKACSRGHEWNAENSTFVSQNGKLRRWCRVCARDRMRARSSRSQ